MAIKLTAPQSRVFEDSSRFRVLVAGRRFGKTHLMVPELVRGAWGPGKLAWYIAPTYKQAKMIAWEKLKTICHPWVAGKPNETELSMRMVSGGQIRLHGAERYDSLRGPGLDFVAFDEYADIDPRAWTEVVRPMLADRLGRAFFAGTPMGHNAFYDLYNTAKTQTDWAAYSFTTIQGGNVSPEEIEAARADLDERTFRQEFQASFENYAGLVYYAFDREKNVAPCRYSRASQLCWALDFNIDPMCSAIFQIEDTTDQLDRAYGRRSAKINVLDEMFLRNSDIFAAAGEFMHRLRALVGPQAPQVEVMVYGDPAGNTREHAGPAVWAALLDSFKANPDVRLTKKVRSSAPHVRDRVTAMNAMLCNAQGSRSIAIDPKCKQLIKDFEHVSWKTDSHERLVGEIDKSDLERSHCSDALGYAVHYEFGFKQQGGPRAVYVG